MTKVIDNVNHGRQHGHHESNTVLMHTYNRPEFFAEYVAKGVWEDIPLLIVDDGSTLAKLELLVEAAQRQGAFLHHYDRNSGVAHAVREGARLVRTPFLMMVGDDDYFCGYNEFVEEAVKAMADEETLVVTMPRVIAFDDTETQQTQYDRKKFDGVRGRDFLTHIVDTGEMLAFQAGSLMRTADVRASVAEDFFRVSEDFVLIARLCAQYPEKKIRVADAGKYMRRIHSGSLAAQHRTNYDQCFIHLISIIVGAHYLIQHGVRTRRQVSELLRKRGQVLQNVHGFGRAAADALAEMVLGKRTTVTSEEIERLAAFLRKQLEVLPEEFVKVVPDAHNVVRVGIRLGPEQEAARQVACADIITAISRNEHEEARRELDAYSAAYGTDLDYWKLRAALDSKQGREDEALSYLTEALADGADTEALCIMAALLERKGRLQEAAGCLARAFSDATLQERTVIESAAERLRKEGVTVVFPRCRLGIVAQQGFDAFLGDLVERLGDVYDVRLFLVSSTADIDAAMEWSEVVWFEWCNEPLIYGSHHPLASSRKIVCRIHRYEAFTDMPQRVEWDRVDALVAVTPHVADIVLQTVPRLNERVAVHVIQNGVNLDTYQLIDSGPGFKVAYIGYLHTRKNPSLLLQICRKLVDIDKRYQLHVAGKFQEPVLKLYWNHMVRELGLEDHVHFDGWQEDIAAWLSDKNYILSTSIHESFGYGIAECMARGIKPVVHNFPFAGEIWPEEILFNTLDEAVALITERDYDPSLYRAFIAEHYALERQVGKTVELIDELAPNESGRTARATARPDPSPRIVGMKPAATGAYISLVTEGGTTTFDAYQGTIGGVAIGIHEAPNGERVEVRPEQFVDALNELLPDFRYEDALERSRAAESVALSWFDRGGWGDVMTYEGLNLGACMSYDLMPWILSGITHE